MLPTDAAGNHCTDDAGAGRIVVFVILFNANLVIAHYFQRAIWMKHHYVPEVYLRNFSKGLSGHFFRIKRGNIRAKQVHASAVCYRKDFYEKKNDDILKVHGLSEKTFLETRGFSYESKWPRIITAFIGNNQYVSRGIYEDLISAYVSIKQRTLWYRKQLSDVNLLDGVFEKVTSEFRKQNQILFKALDVDFATIALESKSKIFDSSFSEEIQLRGLIETVQKTNHAYQDAFIKLLSMNFEIVTPSSPHDRFITGDNPGFSLDGNKIWNTNFGKFDLIVFPVSSKFSIVLKGFSAINHLDVLKRIRIRRISSQETEMINYGTLCVSDEMIFCEDDSYLEAFAKRFASNFRGNPLSG